MRQLIKRLQKLTEHQSRFKTSPKFTLDWSSRKNVPSYKSSELLDVKKQLEQKQQEIIDAANEYFELSKQYHVMSAYFWLEKGFAKIRGGINDLSEVQAEIELAAKVAKPFDYLKTSDKGD